MKRESPEEAALRRAIAELEKTVSASESVRTHIERRMRAAPFWPDRRTAQHWTEHDRRSRKGEEQE
jgi:hypothetical protein